MVGIGLMSSAKQADSFKTCVAKNGDINIETLIIPRGSLLNNQFLELRLFLSFLEQSREQNRHWRNGIVSNVT